MISLLLIGLGTGGIKPCVAAFGGDQFSSDQKKELEQFFSVFYFAINLGSLFSTILTPIIRSQFAFNLLSISLVYFLQQMSSASTAVASLLLLVFLLF
jgi:dipeptide/tripeptide permease